MRMSMLGALGAIVLLAAGCGSSGGAYDNSPRPPAPINVAVSLTNDRVQISPAHVGAGPVVLIVANIGTRSRDLTLHASDGTGSCLESDASSGPINPQGVARMPVELVEGECLVGVRGNSIAPARLTVGHERSSAQADLLQP